MENVEPDDSRWTELMRGRARRQALGATLELPSWPVYAPRQPDQPSWLGEISRRNGQLVAIGFNTSGSEVGQHLVVTNQLFPGGSIPSLDRVLADQFAADGRDYPVPGELPPTGFGSLPAAPRAHPITVALDGEVASGVVQEAGDFGVLRVLHDDVVITAVGRKLHPEGVDLSLVTDIAAYRNSVPIVARTTPRSADWQSDAEWHRPPDRSQPLWAHRGLVTMTMLNFEQHRRAMALNRPHQRLDPDWQRWWAAAIAQQQNVTGQSRKAAHRAISDMVNLLSTLGGRAPWWSNPELRTRAVNQVLWFTTTGDQSLSSAAAQRAWAERGDSGQDGVLAAWAAWAAGQR
ncbi:MAG: hypothetical protein ABWZ02_12635 [Nakamurella sp.]